MLAIDDETAMLDWLKVLFETAGHETRTASNGAGARALLATWQPDVVVTDLLLPDIDGSELVEWITRLEAGIPVIVLTGQGNIPRSVDAVKAGAFDFLEKPIDGDLLLDKIERAFRQKTLVEQNDRLRRQLHDRRPFRGVIGTSEKMRRLFELVDCVAPSEANVLIQGENGTGKELIADAIHENSRRSKGPFIKVNCAAIPSELIESELFGYRKGAFTGAMNDKDGLFKMADGGSLLLDEIGEMSSYLQTKLLRVLQEREYRAIGGDRTVRVDCRLICATNIDVDRARKDGRLREDLYFRINTITLRVPPLRERSEDIPLLCEHFLEKFRQQYQKGVTISAAVRHLLVRHRWLGNVRELEHVIERAILVAKGPEITMEDLPETMRNESALAPEFEVPPNRTLQQIEKMVIVQALKWTNGNKAEAAQMLGLYRPTLYSKMKKHRIGETKRRSGESSASPDSSIDEPRSVDATV
jgi:DNA-binding NtrC family response regulator